MTGLIRGLQPQAPHKRSRLSRHGSGADIGRKDLACEIRRTEQDSLFLWRNPGQEQGSRLLRILDEPRFRRGFRKHLEDVPTRVAPPRLDRIESLKHLGSAHAESVSNDRQAVQDLHYGSLISVETDEPGTLANQGPIEIEIKPKATMAASPTLARGRLSIRRKRSARQVVTSIASPTQGKRWYL